VKRVITVGDWHVLYRDVKLTSIVILCGALNGINIAKLAPSIAVLSSDFDLSLAQIGLLGSMFTVIMVLTGVFIGGVTRRLGAKRVLMTALVVACVGNALAILGNTVGGLFAGRAIEGVSLIAITLTAPAILTRYTAPAHRGWVMGAWGGFMPLGNGLAIFGASVLIADGGWQMVWQAGMWFSVLITLLAFCFIPKDPEPARIWFDTRALRDAMRMPLLAVIGITFACHSLIYQTLLQFMPLAAQSLGGFSPGEAALIAGVFCVINFFGNLAAGQFLQRGWSPATIVSIVFSTILLLLGAVSLVDLPPMILAVCFILIGLVSGGTPPVFFYLASRSTSDPHDLPMFVAWVFQIQGLGMLVGPSLVSHVVDVTQSWAIGLLCLVPACAAILLLCRLLVVPQSR